MILIVIIVTVITMIMINFFVATKAAIHIYSIKTCFWKFWNNYAAARGSSAGVFLWISLKFLKHIFYRVTPDDEFCSKEPED